MIATGYYQPCPKCGGTGKHPANPLWVCDTCGGSGRIWIPLEP